MEESFTLVQVGKLKR